MPRLPYITLLALTACAASPSPTFFGATAQSTTVAGRSFTIYREENRVQVIRHGWADAKARDDIPEQMLIAVAQATGCTPIADSFIGDSGERRGRIKCSRQTAP